MRNITIKASQLKKAEQKAKSISQNWQAVICEILLIPAINKRWHEFNTRYPDLTIERHDGQVYPEGLALKQKIEDWSVYAGYTLSFSCNIVWNSVSTGSNRGYNHSAGTTFDGIRRETHYQFAYDLHVAYSLLAQGKEIGYRLESDLREAHIALVNDL